MRPDFYVTDLVPLFNSTHGGGTPGEDDDSLGTVIWWYLSDLAAAINPSIFGHSDSCLLALSAILKFYFCQPEHDAGYHPSNGTA